MSSHHCPLHKPSNSVTPSITATQACRGQGAVPAVLLCLSESPGYAGQPGGSGLPKPSNSLLPPQISQLCCSKRQDLLLRSCLVHLFKVLPLHESQFIGPSLPFRVSRSGESGGESGTVQVESDVPAPPPRHGGADFSPAAVRRHRSGVGGIRLTRGHMYPGNVQGRGPRSELDHDSRRAGRRCLMTEGARR